MSKNQAPPNAFLIDILLCFSLQCALILPLMQRS